MNNQFSEKVKENLNLYQIYCYKDFEDYLRQYSSISRIGDLVYRATYGRLLDGTTHNHQRRVELEAKRQMVIKVNLNIEIILSLEDFHAMWTFLEDLRVDGYGDLAIYDCALRLASTKGIYPEYVYIQQDSKIGAELLLGKPLSKFRYIEANEFHDFYPELSQLPSHHLENFLCIYSDAFTDLS